MTGEEVKVSHDTVTTVQEISSIIENDDTNNNEDKNTEFSNSNRVQISMNIHNNTKAHVLRLHETADQSESQYVDDYDGDDDDYDFDDDIGTSDTSERVDSYGSSLEFRRSSKLQKKREKNRRAIKNNKNEWKPRTPCIISCLRQSIIYLYVVLTISITNFLYIMLRNNEYNTFEDEYNVVTDNIVSTFKTKFEYIINSMNSYSIATTSYAIETNSSWPFVTIRDFDLLVDGTFLLQSQLLLAISLNILVTNATRLEWERYSINNIDWLYHGLKRKQHFSSIDNNRIFGSTRHLMEREKQSPSSSYYNNNIMEPGGNPDTISEYIFRFDEKSSIPTDDVHVKIYDDSNGPFFPSWQSVPLSFGSVNYNLLSHAVDHQAIMHMIETTKNEVIMSRVTYLPKNLVSNSNKEDDILSLAKIYSNSISPQHHQQQEQDTTTRTHNIEGRTPITNMYFPVYNDNLARNSTNNNRDLVAMFSTTIVWEKILNSLLIPPNSKTSSVLAIIDNKCNDVFSYEIGKDGINFLGNYDMHHSSFENFVITFDLNSILYDNETSLLSSSVDDDNMVIPILSDQFCSYSIRLYPTMNVWNTYITKFPLIISCIVLSVFLIIFGTCVRYDCILRRRLNRISKFEHNATKVASSHFPDAVRQRLRKVGSRVDDIDGGRMIFSDFLNRSFHSKSKTNFFRSNNNDTNVNDKKLNNNKKIQRGRRGRGNNKQHHNGDGYDINFDMEMVNEQDDYNIFLHQEPIADLFLHCTVLFADICGFSAWSSEREPEQVFLLLEVIFQSFDKIARRKGVFKVETIQDSYVAVTGLPERQPDHAIRMTSFARICLKEVNKITRRLEVKLGPDTGDLRVRFGLNSGPVTAGVLRGEKSRFQLFGDTVNTASRMESTGLANMIHLSENTANYLIQDGYSNWIQFRRDPVNVKGKGIVNTYWAVHSLRRDADEYSSSGNSLSGSEIDVINCEDNNDFDNNDDEEEILDEFFHKRDLWGADDDDDDKQGIFTMPEPSKISKNKRLIDWMTEFMVCQLQKVVAQREHRGYHTTTCTGVTETEYNKGKIVLDEVVETFTLPEVNPMEELINTTRIDDPKVDIDPQVYSQLHDYIEAIADRYRDNNAFHNFEHASHVTMSVMKLLNRIVAPDDREHSPFTASRTSLQSDIHEFTYGITSDALAQFAVAFSALIHDVDHTGVSNGQLSKENPELGEKYRHRSVAEQNSVDVAWELLMDQSFKDLRNCIAADRNELNRFRQYVVNLVMATDIFDKEMKTLRNRRWEKAFFANKVTSTIANTTTVEKSLVAPHSTSSIPNESNDSSVERETSNLKATIVLEHLIQASDVSHTMQHWKVYKKWNERLFQEMYAAYEFGRAEKDPSEGWYKGELWFFDNYIIPLAKKLNECRVFGVSSDECLDYATLNRNEWKEKGQDIVKDMVERYKKRKNLEVGGFTPDEVNAFTTKELEYIIQLLIKKGRAFGSIKVSDKSGQRTAAQSWLDALEIFERAPSASGLKDRTIIFPIFSGLLVFLKGGKILQSEDCTFEQNLSNMFVNETKTLVDHAHYTRALAMLCEVKFRAFKLDEAFESFEIIKDLYDPKKHSETICKAYGTDRTAHAFSQSALWFHQLGDEESSIKACDYVIDNILPYMDPKNILSNCELLYPIVRLRKMRGDYKNMRDLFDSNVVQNFHKYDISFTPCIPLFKPILMLLDICHDPDSIPNFNESYVQYLLKDDVGICDDFLDNIYVKLGWAPNSIWAELYLRVSKKLQTDGGENVVETVKTLVRKGIIASRSCEWKIMKINDVDDDGKSFVRLPVAHEIQEPISKELSKFAKVLGLSEDDIEKPDHSSDSQQVPLATKLGLVRLCA